MKAAQPSLAHKQKQFPSTTNSEEELQTVNEPSCTPTLAYQNELAAGNDIPRVQEYSFHSQSLSDISPAEADASYINPGSLPYPSVDCIPACRDTLVPDGILQRQISQCQDCLQKRCLLNLCQVLFQALLHSGHLAVGFHHF